MGEKSEFVVVIRRILVYHWFHMGAIHRCVTHRVVTPALIHNLGLFQAIFLGPLRAGNWQDCVNQGISQVGDNRWILRDVSRNWFQGAHLGTIQPLTLLWYQSA